MAILFQKTGSRRLFLALAMSVLLANYSLAQSTNVKNSSKSETQAATEVFDVKSKDIPAPDTHAPSSAAPLPSGNEIPPPDFKAFEDDKFINNLLTDEDKKVAKPATKPAISKDTEPQAPVKAETDAPTVIPDLQNSPAAENKGGNINNPAPTAANPATTTTTAPTTEIQAVTPASPDKQPAVPAGNNSQNANQLSPEEVDKYTELKQHLLNFIEKHTKTEKGMAKSESKPALAATATPENKDSNIVKAPADNITVEHPADTAPVVTKTEETSPVLADGPPALPPVSPQNPVVTKTGETSPVASVPPALPSAHPENMAKTAEKAPEAKKPSGTDDFNDFLEPNKNQPIPAKPAPATNTVKTVNTQNPVVNTATPQPQEQGSKITATMPPAPVIKDNTTPKPIKETVVVEPLPQKKFDEEALDKIEVSIPQEREKLSDADKAYLQLLDKQRAELPDDKKLSAASIATIEGISGELAPLKKGAKKEPQYITIQRGNTGEPGLQEDGVIKSQSKMDISVRKADSGEDFEKSKIKLARAYKALMVGQNSAAISIYKQVLEKEPKNKDALFGIATAYHKNNQYEQAREIYTQILKKDPADTEALNNFLVLVAEEAPEDALIELEKLERINSNFSPIAAQIAMINLRLGNNEKAARYLRRAILLSPDNLSYKYNLAVVYDKSGKEEQALPLYHQVVDAAKDGGVIPGSIDQITKRMHYLEKKISDRK